MYGWSKQIFTDSIPFLPVLTLLFSVWYTLRKIFQQVRKRRACLHSSQHHNTQGIIIFFAGIPRNCPEMVAPVSWLKSHTRPGVFQWFRDISKWADFSCPDQFKLGLEVSSLCGMRNLPGEGTHWTKRCQSLVPFCLWGDYNRVQKTLLLESKSRKPQWAMTAGLIWFWVLKFLLQFT